MLDGGWLPDGTEIESNIGGSVSDERIIGVESEIRRILYAYQQQQLDRMNRDMLAYGGKNTFSAGEILASVEDVQIDLFADVLLCRIVLRVASGDALSFTVPIR